MGVMSAVHWWEESQMRVLILSSLVVQFLLFIFSYVRRFAIPRFLRSIMWLAYLAGDAVAIYALATLFNRHKDDQDRGGSSSTLEVVWAPVLLLHLGGHDSITAYNIEDNELWSRHLLTAVSQVTVAIYVFCKSWPGTGGNKRLLQAAILLFVPGVLKCFAKPWALKSASINSLVSSPGAQRTAKRKEGKMDPLEEYVIQAKAFVVQEQIGRHEGEAARASAEGNDNPPSQQDRQRRRQSIRDVLYGDSKTFELMRRRARAFVLGRKDEDFAQNEGTEEQNEGEMDPLEEYVKGERAFVQDGDHPPSQLGADLINKISIPVHPKLMKREMILNGEACKLFVDLSSPYPIRLTNLKYFWGLSEEKADRAYGFVRGEIASAFLLLYTKLKTSGIPTESDLEMGKLSDSVKLTCSQCIHLSRMVLPWAAIALFHKSHREAYDDIDVKITYAIFCCTAVLEAYSQFPVRFKDYSDMPLMGREQWPEMVAQYNLVGYFARNKKHSKKMWIVSLFGCKEFLDQRWCMRLCFSSGRITDLVLQYLKAGWKEKIQDAASYRRFNDNRGHWALEGNEQQLGWSIKGPFDESVLLWHIATDFCFFLSPFSDHKCAFAKIPSIWSSIPIWSSKASVFVFNRASVFLENLASVFLFERASVFLKNLASVGKDTPLDQGARSECGELTACKAVLCRQMSNYMMYLLLVNPEMLLPGTRRNLFTTTYNELKGILSDDKPVPVKEEGLVQRVISIMQGKSKKASEEESKEASEEERKQGSKDNFIDDAWALAQGLLELGDKMWEVIQGVWVEMLCFSASRCRGYLHAKALGSGGEFLSYVWLLLSYMGMETLTERLQRPSHQERNNNATPPPSDACNGMAPSTSKIHACTAPSTSNVHTSAGMYPSTSTCEIHIAGEEMV